MTRTQIAVPLLAALLGSAITATALTATGNGTGTDRGPAAGPRQQGLVTAAASEAGTLTARAVYEQAAPSVVAVQASSVQGVAGPFASGETVPTENVSTGSGFVLDDDGRIVTSARVVSGVTGVQVTFPDLRRVPARVVGKDEETDIAVLAVDPEGLDLRPLELGDSDAVRAGDRAMAIGNPSGLGATAGTGTVSSPHQRVETPTGFVLRDVIATDAAILPSTSGGPLLGADGRVIGISSGIGAEDTNAAYAIPANTAKDVLAQLQERHKLIRPYLGIRGRTLGAARDASVEGGASSGVLVLDVYAGSPAANAGLQGGASGGDVIEAIDGRQVTTLADLLADVDSREPGDTVTLTVVRDGSRGEVEVTLAERPATLPPG